MLSNILGLEHGAQLAELMGQLEPEPPVALVVHFQELLHFWQVLSALVRVQQAKKWG